MPSGMGADGMPSKFAGMGGPMNGGANAPGMSHSHKQGATVGKTVGPINTCMSNDVECNLWFKLNQKFEGTTMVEFELWSKLNQKYNAKSKKASLM